MEANLDFTVNTGAWTWIARANYALSQSLNYGSPQNWADGSYGRQLPYIPVHSANLNISAGWRGWSVLYTWIYYSERFTTASNLRTSNRDYLYPYFMNQVILGKKIHAGPTDLDFSLGIYNLFNETYRSVLQRQMPGRNFELTGRLHF